MVALSKVVLALVALAFLLSTLSVAHTGLGFGWGGGSSGSGGGHGLLPEYYLYSCPQVNDIVVPVLEQAIEREPRMAASLLRLHFHDCFVQV